MSKLRSATPHACKYKHKYKKKWIQTLTQTQTQTQQVFNWEKFHPIECIDPQIQTQIQKKNEYKY